MQARSGVLRDSALFRYPPNANCEWLIRPVPLAFSIRLDFDAGFDVENNFDSVRVFDGPNVTSPLLAMLSGVRSGDVLYNYNAYSGSMLVKFTSDASISGTGFSARYVANQLDHSPIISNSASANSLSDNLDSDRTTSRPVLMITLLSVSVAVLVIIGTAVVVYASRRRNRHPQRTPPVYPLKIHTVAVYPMTHETCMQPAPPPAIVTWE